MSRLGLLGGSWAVMVRVMGTQMELTMATRFVISLEALVLGSNEPSRVAFGYVFWS